MQPWKRTLHSTGLCSWLSLRFKQFLINSLIFLTWPNTLIRAVGSQVLPIDLNFTNGTNLLVRALFFQISYYFNYRFIIFTLHLEPKRSLKNFSLVSCLEKKIDILKGKVIIPVFKTAEDTKNYIVHLYMHCSSI